MKKKEEEEIKGKTTNKISTINKESKVKAFLNDIKKEFEKNEIFLDNTNNNLNQIDKVLGKLSKKDPNLINPAVLNDNLSQTSKSLSTANNDISKKQESKEKSSSNNSVNAKAKNTKSSMIQNNKSNKSNLININNSNLLNLEEIPETSNPNINLINLQNLINKEEDTLSPIIRNKNVSEFLSNNKLINTELKSTKKSREINVNSEDPKIYENPFEAADDNNYNSFFNNKNNNYNNKNLKTTDKQIEENLETPKNKKASRKTTQTDNDLNCTSNNTKGLENKHSQNKLNNNNDNNKEKLNEKITNVNSEKNIIYSSGDNQEPGTSKKINQFPNDIKAPAQRIRERPSEQHNEHEKGQEQQGSQTLILNSERIKQQDDPKKAEKVVFTLSKINEPLNNNFGQSRAFEFFDSNELESTKARVPFQSDNWANNENDEVKKNFNFNNLDFVPIENENENEIDNSKRFCSKTLTNFHNSNEYFGDNYNSENNNFNFNNGNKNEFNFNSNNENNNDLSNNENMIVLKTESDELNQSNDLKEKINELNMSMKLRKSGSLNFTEENRKNLLKGKLLRKSNTYLASSINSNKNSSKNLVSLSATNKNILNNYLSNKNSNNLNNSNSKFNGNTNNNNFNNSKTLNLSKSINFSKINNLNNFVNNNKQNQNHFNNNNNYNNRILSSNFNNTNPATQNNTNFLTTNPQDLTNENQIFNVNYDSNNNKINNQSKRNSGNNLPDMQRSAQKLLRGSLILAAQGNQIFPTSSYTYHNSSYLKDAEPNESLYKSKYENSKIFETAEIMALISNAKSLEKVLSDDSPLTKIDEFERKLRANAKLIESLQGNSADLLHDKMDMEIKIKEVKGLINQFNDRFVKIDKFLDKGKLKNYNSEFNRTVFDESEYMPNSKSFLFSDSNGKKTFAQPFSSFKKKAELSANNTASGEKLNRTFHPKNKNFNISSGKKKNDLNNAKRSEKEKRKERKAEKFELEKIECAEKALIEESSTDKQLIKGSNNSKSASKDALARNKNLEIKNVSRIKPNNKNKIAEESILKQEKVVENSIFEEEKRGVKANKIRSISSGGSDLGENADHNLNSYNNKKLIFSKEDEEELENLENEIKKIDFDLKMNKENHQNKNFLEKSKEKPKAKHEQDKALKSSKEENQNSLDSSQQQKKNYKKIEINKLLPKRNGVSREKNKATEKYKNENERDKDTEYPNNERTMRSNLRSTKYDSDFNNVNVNSNNNYNDNQNKGNFNTTNEIGNYNNMTKIQKILHDLESIKNRNLNADNSKANKNVTDIDTKANNSNNQKQKRNKLNDNSVSKRFHNNKINKSKYSNFNSKYNSGNEFSSAPEEEEDDDFDSQNKTYHKSNKTFIDSDNSKLINKFLKEEKIAEAIEIWKRLDYGRFEGMSLDRSYEMMAQITKIKDKDIEKLFRKLGLFNQIQAESSKKDTEIIELVGEVESLKYKIIEMESQIGNYKNLENKINEVKNENSFLFKENVKLRALLDQERYFNSYRNQPNFMKK